jgi:CRISPR system Cascade subunit CasE
MYLSRLIINPRSAQVRGELARPYEMHRTLLRAFPEGKVGVSRDKDDAAGVLFRVDEEPRESVIVVLVQSKIAADWSFLNNQRDARGHPYLLPASMIGDGKPNPAMTEFDLSKKLAVGQTLAFRLRANPTKRLGKAAGDDKSKRVGIYKEEDQLKWLREKLEGNEHRRQLAGGFRLLRAQISREEKIDNPKAINRADQAHDLKVFAAQFDGVLQVVDPGKAIQTIERGIGSAKGLGFGLLSLAPIRE